MSYPFDVPRAGFALDEGRIVARDLPIVAAADIRRVDEACEAVLRNAGVELRIEDPIAYLTCGSNASMKRLGEKLAQCPSPSACALRIRMASWPAVYAAAASFYGAIPATFEYEEGRAAEQFLIITSSANDLAMTQSEGQTGNYDVYAVPPGATALRISCPVFAFVCRFGAIRIDGQLLTLREFQSDPTAGVGQADAVEAVLARVAPGMTIEALRPRLSDKAFVVELRQRIIQTFGRRPIVPGWELVAH